MKVTTLGELGAKLPIGFRNGSTLEKSFQLRPFKAKIDRQLGLWLEANSSKHAPGPLVAYQVAKLISLLCSQAGGKAFSAIDGGNAEMEAEYDVLKWYFADVLYAYLYARVQTLGPELEVRVPCTNGLCSSKTVKVIFDLNTVEVNVLEDAKELSRWYSLKRPYKLRSGDILKSVLLEPIRWSTMVRPGVMSGNMQSIHLSSLQDAICGINNNSSEARLLEADIDEMEKIDRIAIDRFIDTVSAGVKLATEVTCPTCKTRIINPLNWMYEHFFGESLPLAV